jgi:hypothetical protein
VLDRERLVVVGAFGQRLCMRAADQSECQHRTGESDAANAPNRYRDRHCVSPRARNVARKIHRNGDGVNKNILQYQ